MCGHGELVSRYPQELAEENWSGLYPLEQVPLPKIHNHQPFHLQLTDPLYFMDGGDNKSSFGESKSSSEISGPWEGLT